MFFIFISCLTHDQLHRNPPSCVFLVFQLQSPMLASHDSTHSRNSLFLSSPSDSVQVLTDNHQHVLRIFMTPGLKLKNYFTNWKKSSSEKTRSHHRTYSTQHLYWNIMSWLLWGEIQSDFWIKRTVLVFRFWYWRLENIKTHISHHVYDVSENHPTFTPG